MTSAPDPPPPHLELHRHSRSRAGSAASISLAASLASGTSRPISPPPRSPLSSRVHLPLQHPFAPTISVPASKPENENENGNGIGSGMGMGMGGYGNGTADVHLPADPDSPPPPEEGTPLRVAAHYAVLVLSAMLGTLARLGLEAMGSFDGAVIFSLAWAQGVGCGVMGIAAARKNQLYWWYPPFHTFIGTGLAGCITTFSSWMLDGWLAFSNFGGYQHSGFYNSVDGIGYSCATLAISMACLSLGAHLSSLVPKLPARKSIPKETPFLDMLMILSAALAYTAALLIYFLAPDRWRYRVTFALLLAPPGAMLRYFLSRLNTLPIIAGKFPLGTFIANMVGTLVIAGVFAAQHRPPSDAVPVRCDGLHALQEGFCGSLSTVSTFALELTALKGRRWRWIYLWTSVVLGHVFVLAVFGGVKWSIGVDGMCTGTDP